MPILASKITRCVSISAAASLGCAPVGITSFALGIKLCAITARIKQCNTVFIDEKLAMKVFMSWRAASAHKFRRRLGFKQYDVTLDKKNIHC